MKTLLIRADASSDIGSGHVMRCLALAQAWQDTNGRAIFVMATEDRGIQQRLAAERMEVFQVSEVAGSKQDAERTRNIALSLEAEWLVLDGYHFSPHYRSQLLSPCRLVVVDDHAEFPPYDCDLLLNANIYAAPAMYAELPEHTRTLLGTKYALLRREFLTAPLKHRIPDTVFKILVTFGGSDPHNVSLLVLNALAQLSINFDVVVVAGSSNPHLDALRTKASELRFPVRVLSNVSNMPELMDWADLGISAGGGTCFEFAIRKVPMLLITMASNHERTVETFRESGAAVSPGWFHSLDVDHLSRCLQKVADDASLRVGMVEQAAKLVDGAGAERIVKMMCNAENQRRKH
jgi:UDP-2,4-diacetamido-2,4,6-trideoxy-beta-L-altropyranose hydrolase